MNGPGTVILIRRSVLARKELHVFHFDGVFAPNWINDPRDWIGMAGSVKCGARVVDIHAFEGGRKAVGIAFAAHLAIGDDIETGAFLIPNGEDRGVVLGLLKEFLVEAP